jgi:mannose-6-phosphate isomerase
MMYKLENTVQHYAWGSPVLIPEFLGLENPGNEPWAELWMGAHPQAPSRCRPAGGDAGESIPLDKLISSNPEAFLGGETAKAFGGQFPFLLKLLAAASPLSIQCHPSALQAREGFERENRAGIPPNAGSRNYKDASHKPEIILALTPFCALRGLRPLDETIRFFSAFPVPALRAAAAFLEKKRNGGIMDFLRTLLSASHDEASAWIETLKNEGGAAARNTGEFRTFLRLADWYPEDSGCLAPFYLNLVDLKPGEALFLGPGEMHAYLGGLGVELMANSDNVLRAGLTSKHIDIQELLACLSGTAGKAEILRPAGTGRGGFIEEEYPRRAKEFTLSVLRPAVPTGAEKGAGQGAGKTVIETTGPEILFCGGGSAILESAEGPCTLRRGESVFVPASQGTYTLSGSCTLYRARVPSQKGADAE